MSANPHLLTEEALMEWTGFERRADLEKWLKALGIKPRHGKGGAIVTTLEAVNDAMRSHSNDFNSIEFADGPAKSH